MRMSTSILFASTAMLLAAASFAQSAGKGRPVMLRRNPEIHDIKLEVELFQQQALNAQGGSVKSNGKNTANNGNNTAIGPAYQMQSASIGIPVMVRTSWCDTDFSKYTVRVTLDGQTVSMDPARVLTKLSGSAEGILKYDFPVPNGGFSDALMQTVYQVQRWDLDVDEQAAMSSTWPREWPKGTQRFLEQELGINPANPALKALAEGATKGGPRSVSPFLAAKNAVLMILPKWKSFSSTTSVFGQKGTLRGLAFSQNGQYGIEAGGGTPVELAATCVSALRSIGIPSRIVYCLQEGQQRRRDREPVQFRFVCEFFLPDIGWIPFDPLIMRQQAPVNDPSTTAVKGFANIPDLQEALPLSLLAVPAGYEMADRYAAWGWMQGAATRAQVDPDRASTRIGFSDAGRGNGKTPTMPAPVMDEAP